MNGTGTVLLKESLMSRMTKGITVNEDGETEITVELDNSGSNDSHGLGTGNNSSMPMMNQTIVIESKELESVEAFGMKAKADSIGWAVVALIVLLTVGYLVKEWVVKKVSK